jgi:CBS-domain-containing membrane protein
MEKHQIRRLPVLNRQKLLVGIVSLGDFATKDDETRAGETLERVSEPSRWRSERAAHLLSKAGEPLAQYPDQARLQRSD